MHEETISYKEGKTTLKGFAVFDDKSKAKRPAVIVAHAWKGQDDFARDTARQLAALGYVGFAADVYGDGKTVESNEEAQELMFPLFVERKELRARIVAAFATVSKHPLVDSTRICAVGFCFGGLTVIELLRSGAKVKGVVSFHGVLGNTMGAVQARIAPNAEKLHGALLLLHGHEDPLVSDADIKSIQTEMTTAGVDWEMDIYSHTSHAFTNPSANDRKLGLIYNPKAQKRSWTAMRNFFEEIL